MNFLREDSRARIKLVKHLLTVPSLFLIVVAFKVMLFEEESGRTYYAFSLILALILFLCWLWGDPTYDPLGGGL